LSNILISGHDNEDIRFDYTILSEYDGVPLDLTHYDLESDIVNVKTGASVLRLSTNGGDHRIIINSAIDGAITLIIPQGSIPYDPKVSLAYDVIGKNKLNGLFTRLFGGPVKILNGLTNPL